MICKAGVEPCQSGRKTWTHPPVIRLLERRERLGVPADLLGPVLGHAFGGDGSGDSTALALLFCFALV
jgi:hypothetical protein